MRKLLISLGLVVCLVMAFALPMCAPAPPVEEEEVPPVEEELASYLRAYCSLTLDNGKLQGNFIKENLGVEIRYTISSCGEIEAKLLAESPHFSGDIVLGSCSTSAFTAKREGFTLPYDSPPWRDETRIEWKDPDNNIFGTGKFSFVAAGNENMLAEAGYALPESWDDLLDPKWKGQIVMPSPLTSGTAYMMVHTFMAIYGFNKGLTGSEAEEAGWKYLEALNKNVHHYTRSGNAPTDLVGRGEFMMSVTSDENILNRLELGYPLVWGVPKEGTGYDVAYCYILKGCKELYTCQKLIDLAATVGFAQTYAKMGYATRLPKAPSALYAEFPGGAAPYVQNIRMEWANEERSRLCDEWEERIGRVAQ